MDGVWRFEIVLAGDYDAAYALFRDTVAASLAIDSHPSTRWEKIENGKPVYVEPLDDDG